MPTIFYDEFDAQDTVAEGIFINLIKDDNYIDPSVCARKAYGLAEAFLEERQRRTDAEIDE